MTLKSLVLIIAFLLVSFLAIGNSYSEDNGVKFDELVGIWKPDVPQGVLDMFLKFNGDSTFSIAYDVEKLETRPVDKGKIKIEGKQVTFISSGSPTCKDKIGKYDIKLSGEGNFQLAAHEDPCSDRRSIFVPEWTRVKP